MMAILSESEVTGTVLLLGIFFDDFHGLKVQKQLVPEPPISGPGTPSGFPSGQMLSFSLSSVSWGTPLRLLFSWEEMWGTWGLLCLFLEFLGCCTLVRDGPAFILLREIKLQFLVHVTQTGLLMI